MKTVTNANVKMDSKVTDMSATSTSHHALVTSAVTMKSAKLSLTNMVPKHVSANVPPVSSKLLMVVLLWDHAMTITAIQKLHASRSEAHTPKDSHANVMMVSKVMVLTSAVPLIHVPTVTQMLNAKPCLVTVEKMLRNASANPHTLVTVSTAEEVQLVTETAQEDQSAGMENVHAPTPVTGTTGRATNAKILTNVRRNKIITAQRMQAAEIPLVVSSVLVMLDSRVMVSHASLQADLVHTLIQLIHTHLLKLPSICQKRATSMVLLVLICHFSLSLKKENALSWVTTGLPSLHCLQKWHGSNPIKNQLQPHLLMH